MPLENQIMWITLPTFALDQEQQKELERILKKIVSFRHKKAVVFDLRGNQGGNSEYGSQIIKAFFGQNYANQKKCLANKLVFVDWRASVGNLSHVSHLLDRYKSSWLNEVKEGLKQSLAKRAPYYRETSSVSCSSKDEIEQNYPVTSKIIIVTDTKNFSAALDFIDELKIMEPKAKLIGQKTNADRLYMEVRSVELPSGLGRFSFPIKVYRNRPRLDNEPYLPDIEYNNISDSKELQKFIIKKINTFD